MITVSGSEVLHVFSSLQAVIIPCGLTATLPDEEKTKLLNTCSALEGKLKDAGIRAKGDYRDNYSPGWKFNHWELKVLLFGNFGYFRKLLGHLQEWSVISEYVVTKSEHLETTFEISRNTANTSGQLSIPLMLRKDKAKFQSSTAIEYYASLIWAFSFNHKSTFKRCGMAYGASNIVLFDVGPWRKSKKERVSNDH